MFASALSSHDVVPCSYRGLQRVSCWRRRHCITGSHSLAVEARNGGPRVAVGARMVKEPGSSCWCSIMMTVSHGAVSDFRLFSVWHTPDPLGLYRNPLTNRTGFAA